MTYGPPISPSLSKVHTIFEYWHSKDPDLYIRTFVGGGAQIKSMSNNI